MFEARPGGVERVILPMVKGLCEKNFLGTMAEGNSVKKNRFTESQILAVLRQAEVGCLVPDLCREHGVSTATF